MLLVTFQPSWRYLLALKAVNRPYYVIRIGLYISVSLILYSTNPYLNPKRFHSSWTSFVDGESVGKVDHLVLRSVDDKNWGADFWHFVNAAKRKNIIRQAIFFYLVLFSGKMQGFFSKY